MTISSELIYEFGPFRLLTGPGLLLKAGKPVRLGSRAREILIFLVERAGRTVRKAELVKRVWPDTIVEEGTLRVHIAKLRKALEDGQRGMRYIESVTGHGYRFVAPLSPLDNSSSSRWARPEPAAGPTRGLTPVRSIGRTQLLQALSTAICDRLAAALGLPQESDSLQQIVRLLADPHFLLDSCECVVEAAAILAPDPCKHRFKSVERPLTASQLKVTAPSHPALAELS